MKQTTLPPTTTLTLRSVNGSGNVISGSNSASGIHFVLQQQQQRTGQNANGQQPNGNQVVFRRYPPNNVVQVRRIITQQPQQFQHIVAGVGDDSSSGSSVAYEPTRTPGQLQGNRGVSFGARGRGMNTARNIIRRLEADKKLDGGGGKEKGLDVDISLVRCETKEQEDDNDNDDSKLVIDEMNDDDETAGGMEIDDDEAGEEKSALEMNGQGVDSEYLRHVIETQILNRHKTKIKDWDGTKGHMCQSCHETFLSEGGLEIHRNRRILHILFFCRICKRDLSFFNKCRLLQHLRNHRVTPSVSGLQNCTMIRLLPESEYLHFKYEECTSSSDEDDVGGSTGGGGSGSGGSSPPKRLKPSRFRRIARSSLSNNDKDSDSPPPTTTTLKISAPQKKVGESATNKQQTPPKEFPSANSSTVVPVSSNGNTVPAIKYVGGNATTSGNDTPKQLQALQRNEQVTVIKSTGNTASVIIPSPASKSSSNPATDGNVPQQIPTLIVPPPSSPPESPPQIRIKSLSQLTESDNLSRSPKEDGSQSSVVQFRPQIVKISSVPITTTETPPTSAVTSGKKNLETQPIKDSGWRCYKCDIDFTSGEELFKHLQEAEQQGLTAKSLHRCTTDDIPSWSQCQYVYHTKVFHERSVNSMCPGCGYQAPDHSTLLSHVTNDCFYISLRARYLCAAAPVTTPKCSFAEKSVKTEPEIVDHLKKEHSRAVLQCVHCTQGFATENWLIKHLVEVHRMNFDESISDAEREALINKTTRPLTQCLICNILFPNGPTFLQHVYLNFHMHILHAKMLECQGCFAVFETNEELATHRQQSETCRKLNPLYMKISWSATELDGLPMCNPINNSTPISESSTLSSIPQQVQMTPTPIKIIANPAAIITATVSSQPNGKTNNSQQPTQQTSHQASNSQSQIEIQQAPIKTTTQQPSQPTPQGSSQPLPISIIRPSSHGGPPAIVAVISTSSSNGTSQIMSPPPMQSNAQQRSQTQHPQHPILTIQKQANTNNPSTTSAPTSNSLTTTTITNPLGNNMQKKTTQIVVLPNNKQPSGTASPASTPPSINISPPNLRKSFFNNLLQCQFCERLVVFSSLRKHEDQCCGLSTVSPGFCLCCRKYFGDRKTLARHGVIHIKEGLPICLFCNNRHIRPTHPKSTTPSPHENLYALKKHLYSNHTSKLAKFPFQCPICDQTCRDKRQTEFHIKDHQFKYHVNASSEPDPTPIATPPEDLRKFLRVRKKGLDPTKKLGKIVEVFYCPICKNREFSMEAGLSRHLKLVHQKNPGSMNLNMFKKNSTARKLYVVSQESTASAVSGGMNQQTPMLQNLGIVGDRNIKTRASVQSNNPLSGRKDPPQEVKRTGSTSTPSNSSKNLIITTSSSTSSAFTTRFSTGVVLRKRLSTGTVSSAPGAGKRPTPAILQTRSSPAPNTRQRSASSSAESSTTSSRPTPTSRELRPPSNFLQTRSSSSSKVRRKDGTFSCHKCPEFTCKTEDEFCEHIKWKHVWSEEEIQKLQYGNRAGLEEPSEYWCPECNTMFVAKPSLVRHLKFAHDYISNVEDYMQKIGYDGKKPLKPNQCEVCYYQCTDERDHGAHIRTHGMAFLRLRQQRQQMDRQMANKSCS